MRGDVVGIQWRGGVRGSELRFRSGGAEEFEDLGVGGGCEQRDEKTAGEPPAVQPPGRRRYARCSAASAYHLPSESFVNIFSALSFGVRLA